MYDDQANIPFSTTMQSNGIYYISALPLVCTAPALTPDFANAGAGVADENALRHAIYAAIDIVRNREEYELPLANPLPKLYHEKRDESEKREIFYSEETRHQQSARQPITQSVAKKVA